MLEGLQRTRQRADLVAARGVAGIDAQVAGGDLEHGVAHVVQRLDDAAADGGHGAQGQSYRAGEQRELDQERLHRRRALGCGVILGGFERSLGNLHRVHHAADGVRTPLVSGHLRLLSLGDGRNNAITRSGVLGVEVSSLGFAHGGGKRGRQLHARYRQFERLPRRFGTADEFDVGALGLWRDATAAKRIADGQRGFAGGIAQQPGHLLDRQKLVDGRVLMVDARGEC